MELHRTVHSFFTSLSMSVRTDTRRATVVFNVEVKRRPMPYNLKLFRTHHQALPSLAVSQVPQVSPSFLRADFSLPVTT